MTETLYVGFLNEPTGYGAAARAHLLALHEAGHPVRARSVRIAPHGQAPDPVDRRLYPRVAAVPTDHDRGDVALIHAPPEFYELLRVPRAVNVGLCVWELDQLPQRWSPQLRDMNELWVPSSFARAVFARHVTAPVTVIPHPVEGVGAGPRRFPGVPDDLFLFASILQWSDRKNPDGLVRAFVRAFRGRRDVGLLLKLGWRVGDGPTDAALRWLWRATVGVGRFRAPPVFLIAEEIEPCTVAQIYRRADAYVSLHRAEGFGLCLAEAMAAGLPVVATGYSGNLEFMDEDTAVLVRHHLVPVRQRLVHTWFDESMRWAEPDLDHAIDALRWCVDQPGACQRLAAAGQARVREQLAPPRIGAQMRQRLQHVLAAQRDD